MLRGYSMLALVLALVGTVAAENFAGGPLEAGKWVRMTGASNIMENTMAQVVKNMMMKSKQQSAVLGNPGPYLQQQLREPGSTFAQLLKATGLQAQSWSAGGKRNAAQGVTGSLLLNELSTPGKHVAKHLQELGYVAADLYGSARSCGAYTFKPGGAVAPAKWTGPTFTITQTTGACLLQPEMKGSGNSRWTRLQGLLACSGPSTEWEWTPMEYMAISHESASFAGPECKTALKFGEEVSVMLHGGDSSGKMVFETEKDFLTAVALNGTLDVYTGDVRAALQQLQSQVQVNKGALRDLLKKTTAGKVGQQGLSSAGMWMESTSADQSQSPLATLADKIQKGDYLFKGVGQSMFSRTT